MGTRTTHSTGTQARSRASTSRSPRIRPRSVPSRRHAVNFTSWIASRSNPSNVPSRTTREYLGRVPRQCEHDTPARPCSGISFIPSGCPQRPQYSLARSGSHPASAARCAKVGVTSPNHVSSMARHHIRLAVDPAADARHPVAPPAIAERGADLGVIPSPSPPDVSRGASSAKAREGCPQDDRARSAISASEAGGLGGHTNFSLGSPGDTPP